MKAVDTFWFGDFLPSHPLMEKYTGDVRAPSDDWFDSVDCVIHLAGIANDPLVQLHPEISWEIGCLGTDELLKKSVQFEISKFIFASSGSVYGVRPESQVTEETPLTPISLYNKVKIVTERIVKSYENHFICVIVRPATICGPSTRMRLDLAVNALVTSALKNGSINLDGGNQIRPHITMLDMCRVYEFCVTEIKENLTLNAGFENLTMAELAKRVSKRTGARIELSPLTDPRSYRLNSQKLLDIGFIPQSSVSQAIEELIAGYNKGTLYDRPEWHSTTFLRSVLNSIIE